MESKSLGDVIFTNLLFENRFKSIEKTFRANKSKSQEQTMTEYCSEHFEDFLKRKNIIHKKTDIYIEIEKSY